MSKCRRQEGFTLLELSVVLLIISLMVGFGLEATLSTLKTNEITTTRERLKVIRQAMDLYLQQNSRYPCPARLTDVPGGNTYGVESSAAPAVVTNCATQAANPAAGVTDTGTIRIGAVPIRALNLPDEYLRDAWNNKFTYAVSRALTTTATYGGGVGTVGITDGFANNVTAVESPAYVIFSHGPDQKGAYNYKAAAIGVACGATANKDVENCDADAAFIDTQFNDGDVAASFFDDFVTWGMRCNGIVC